MTVHYHGKRGEAAVADVVFVHGLGGDPIDTWTEKGICWPRDLLKDDLDNVRIMSWGYDSGIAHLWKSTSQASVFGHAETLLSDLANLRLTRQEVCRF